MGVWGTRIYDCDEAEEIKEEYIQILREGKSNEEVTKEILENNQGIVEDEEDAPTFWCVLASLQWDYGRLVPEVKEKALTYLKAGYDLETWKKEASQKDYEKRKKEIEKLIEKLESEQPKEKKVSKPFVCDWKIGDIYAYKLVGKDVENTEYENKYIAFQKVENKQLSDGELDPIVLIYDNIFEKVPTIEELENTIFIPLAIYPGKMLYKLWLDNRRVRACRRKDLIYIGNCKIKYPDDIKLNDDYIPWKYLEQNIIKIFEKNSFTKYNKYEEIKEKYTTAERFIEIHNIKNITYFWLGISCSNPNKLTLNITESIANSKYLFYGYNTYNNKVVVKETNTSEGQELLNINKLNITSDMALKIGIEYYKSNEGLVIDKKKNEYIELELIKNKEKIVWEITYYKEILNPKNNEKDITGIYLDIDVITGKIIGLIK